jgi:hypothetical protein
LNRDQERRPKIMHNKLIPPIPIATESETSI